MIGIALPLAAGAIAALLALQGCAGRIEAPASVNDDGTLQVGGERVRLAGIDWPADALCRRPHRTPLPCAMAGRQALAGLLSGAGPIACAPEGRDRMGATIARCRIVSTGTDLSTWMVTRGWAIAAERSLEPLGKAAAHLRLGIWSPTTLHPRPRDDQARDGGGGAL